MNDKVTLVNDSCLSMFSSQLGSHLLELIFSGASLGLVTPGSQSSLPFVFHQPLETQADFQRQTGNSTPYMTRPLKKTIVLAVLVISVTVEMVISRI